jgi:hypothetical protein
LWRVILAICTCYMPPITVGDSAPRTEKQDPPWT